MKKFLKKRRISLCDGHINYIDLKVVIQILKHMTNDIRLTLSHEAINQWVQNALNEKPRQTLEIKIPKQTFHLQLLKY